VTRTFLFMNNCSAFTVPLMRALNVPPPRCAPLISAECMNTAVERLADRVSRETHPLIKQAKDCSSAAVLVLALTAAVVGGVVFVPKFWAALGW